MIFTHSNLQVQIPNVKFQSTNKIQNLNFKLADKWRTW